MNTLLTSSMLIAVALTVLTATPTAQAQQPSRTTSNERTPVAVRTTPQAARLSTTAVPHSTTSGTAANQPPVNYVAAKFSPATPTPPAHSLATTRHKYLNAGIGLAAYYGDGLPLGVSFEVDWKNNISLGGSVDFFRYGYNRGGYRWNYTFVYAGARGSYHLSKLLNIDNAKFDPYAGATIGLRYAGYSDNTGNDNYMSPYNSGLFLGGHLGARYLVSEKLGGFAEVGYGVSALRLGLTAKF